VAVSFPALYCFVANVVGDKGTVTSIKSTQGAHGSEVTATERQRVESSDLLFINGLGLDDEFAKRLQSTSANTQLKIINLGERLPHELLLESDGRSCADEGHAHEHGDHDPHVWLSPDVAIRMVELIRRELSELYPHHKDSFALRANAYTDTLKALKADGKTKLKTKKSERKIVTMHSSMNYFASAFDVTIVDVLQSTPGKEPSSTELKRVIQTCKKENVRVIAAEPQSSTQGAVRTLVESLKQEGIPNPIVIELDPLETAPHADLTPDWYEKKMRANLDALAKVFGP
jgi:zinc transport system substrate-binding protein